VKLKEKEKEGKENGMPPAIDRFPLLPITDERLKGKVPAAWLKVRFDDICFGKVL